MDGDLLLSLADSELAFAVSTHVRIGAHLPLEERSRVAVRVAAVSICEHPHSPLFVSTVLSRANSRRQ